MQSQSTHRSHMNGISPMSLLQSNIPTPRIEHDVGEFQAMERGQRVPQDKEMYEQEISPYQMRSHQIIENEEQHADQIANLFDTSPARNLNLKTLEGEEDDTEESKRHTLVSPNGLQIHTQTVSVSNRDKREKEYKTETMTQKRKLQQNVNNRLTNILKPKANNSIIKSS